MLSIMPTYLSWLSKQDSVCGEGSYWGIADRLTGLPICISVLNTETLNLLLEDRMSEDIVAETEADKAGHVHEYYTADMTDDELSHEVEQLPGEDEDGEDYDQAPEDL